MKVNISRKTKNLEKLIKKIQVLAKNNIEAGYFKEQGDHPTAEMSYVELAHMHHIGDGNFPKRSVFPSTIWDMKSVGFQSMTTKVLKEYFSKDIPLDKSLDRIGVEISGKAVSLYGIPSQYMPMNSTRWAEVKGVNSPLVDEGHLMDAFAWRNSYDNFIKTYSGNRGA